MAKSGFVPAWMKIPSSDKTNSNQKLSIDRTNHQTNISGRQRHHSSDIVNHPTTRQTLFYYSKTNGQCQNKSNEQQQQSENIFSFHSREGLSNNNTEESSIWNSKYPISTNENLSRTFDTNRLITRKDRLLSTPNNFNISSRPVIHELQANNFDKHKEFFNSLKNDLTPEEKELLIRMGWNDDMTYEITDKDKEDYEKQIKLVPKTDNRSARLMSALNRRTLPCINIHDILQLEMIGSASDDDDDSSDE